MITSSTTPVARPASITAACRRLIERSRRLKRIDQLLEVPLIQSNVNVVQWNDWFAAHTDKRPPERFSLRFDRAQMAMEAAILGLGVALESATLAGRHFAEGRLRPIFGFDKFVRARAHFVVYPARHGKRPSVEAFLSWIHSEAAHSGADGQI